MRILKSIFALLLTLSFAHALPAQAGTVKAFVGQYSGAIGDLSVSDPKKAGKLTANTLVRVGGKWLVLPRGTAAFALRFNDGNATRRFQVVRHEPANSNAATFRILQGTGGTHEAPDTLTSHDNAVDP